MAPGGANPNNIDVRSKQRPYAFDLRGRTGVTLANISIFSATIITDEYSSHNTLDRINAKYVSHFTDLPPAADDPTGDQYSIIQVHRSDTGIIINGTGNTVENSTIEYSAGAGIALEGTGNVLRNNLIQHIDYIGNYSSGIDLDGNNNTIQFNTISDVGRQGIIVNAVQNQDISQNDLFNGMLLSRDGAEIYACCNQSASGTRIHHNWIHDTAPVIAGQGDDAATAAVMIDNGSSGFNIDQNVVWNNKNYNIMINGVTSDEPNNNHILNNSIPDSSSGGYIWVVYVNNCVSTRVADNQVAVNVKAQRNGTACSVVNNNRVAPGATEMSTSTQVGCNFAGCASERPPAILEGSVTPCPAL
jgi:hypothetical protein